MSAALRRLFGWLFYGVLYVVAAAFFVTSLSRGVDDIKGWNAQKHWGDFHTYGQDCSSDLQGTTCDLKGTWTSDDGRIFLEYATLTTGGGSPEDIRTYYQPHGGGNNASQEVHRANDGIWDVLVAWGFTVLLGWFLSAPMWRWRRKRRSTHAATEGHEIAQPPPYDEG